MHADVESVPPLFLETSPFFGLSGAQQTCLFQFESLCMGSSLADCCRLTRDSGIICGGSKASWAMHRSMVSRKIVLEDRLVV